MRPVGKARVYVLATRGTREEDFARERTRHLAARGVRVREADPAAFGTERVAGGDFLSLDVESEAVDGGHPRTEE